MTEYWVAHTRGLLDMRKIFGPFQDIESARECAKQNESSLGSGDGTWGEAPAYLRAWYALHPGGPMVDGPHLMARCAESERLENINGDGFEIDCWRDAGFIAVVVELFGGTAVFHRAEIEASEK